jgi:hypothetical protein
MATPLAPQEARAILEMPEQIVGGVRDGLASFYKLAGRLGNTILSPLMNDTQPGAMFSGTGKFGDFPFPEVSAAETGAGALTRGVSQFGIGLVPGFQVARIAQIGPAATRMVSVLGASEKFGRAFGTLASAEVAAQVADQLAFDPFLPRLSNLAQDYDIGGPITDYLAADPDDSEAENRFKLALEGAGLGLGVAGIISGARRMRGRLHSGPRKPVSEVPEATPDTDVILLDTDVGRALREKEPDNIVGKRPEPFVDGEIPAEAVNFNIERITSEDDIRRVIAVTAKEFEGQIDEARRGVIGDAQAQRLADDLGMTVDDLLKRKKGEAFNEEQILASGRVLAATAEHVANTAKAAKGGSLEQKLAFHRALTVNLAVQEQVSGAAAEAGRALRAHRTIMRGDTGTIKELLDSIDVKGRDLDELADLFSSVDSHEGLMAMARATAKPGWKDQAVFIWINALLSGPQTHAVNAMSNTLTALLSVPEQALAAGIGKVTRSADAKTFGGVVSRAIGTVQGSREGLSVFAKALRTGEPSDFMSKVELPHARPIKGGGGAILGIPTRMLQASDEFFKAIGYRQELNQLAYDDAVRAGLKGQEKARHIARILANPDEAMTAAAIDAARRQTFTNPLGSLTRDLPRLKKQHPILGNIVAPFIRTPVNIVKYAGGRTPFGLAMTDVKAQLAKGGAERDVALARMALGTTIGIATMSLASEGKITGGGPRDQISRAALRQTGWQPYSILWEGRYHSYSRMEPAGILLGVSADLTEIAGHVSEGDLDRAGAMLIAAVSNNLANKTFMQGISNAVEMLSNPERYGENYLMQLGGTLIPTGVAQLSRVRDPVFRDAQTFIDKLKSRTPLSTELPPRVDIWGEPIAYESTGDKRVDVINPIWLSTQTDDRVRLEFQRLNVRRGTPRIRTVRGINLGPEEFYAYSATAGKLAKQQLDLIVGTRGWEALPDEVKTEIFEDRIDKSRNAARRLTLAKKIKTLVE